MGENTAPTTQLGDVEYLRTLSNPRLKHLRKRTQRSVDELAEYLTAMDTVLKEREGETGATAVETGYDMGGSCAEAAATFPQYTKRRTADA